MFIQIPLLTFFILSSFVISSLTLVDVALVIRYLKKSCKRASKERDCCRQQTALSCVHRSEKFFFRSESRKTHHRLYCHDSRRETNFSSYFTPAILHTIQCTPHQTKVYWFPTPCATMLHVHRVRAALMGFLLHVWLFLDVMLPSTALKRPASQANAKAVNITVNV